MTKQINTARVATIATAWTPSPEVVGMIAQRVQQDIASETLVAAIAQRLSVEARGVARDQVRDGLTAAYAAARGVQLILVDRGPMVGRPGWPTEAAALKKACQRFISQLIDEAIEQACADNPELAAEVADAKGKAELSVPPSIAALAAALVQACAAHAGKAKGSHATARQWASAAVANAFSAK